MYKNQSLELRSWSRVHIEVHKELLDPDEQALDTWEGLYTLSYSF